MTGSGGDRAALSGDIVAQLDDRDVAQLLQALELDGAPASDEELMAWLEGGAGKLSLRWRDRRIAVERLGPTEAPQRFGFVRGRTF
jgi:hypothetical protein